jgi:hypothetical protein
MENGSPAEVALCGHAKGIVGQLVAANAAAPYKYDASSPWWGALREKVDANRKVRREEGGGRRREEEGGGVRSGEGG